MTDALAYEAEPDDIDAEAEAPASEGQAQPAKLLAFMRSVNIAVDLDAAVLARLGERVCEEFQADEESRIAEGWQGRHDAALKLAMQVKEAKDYPWPKAANVKYPLITVAAIQFAARAYPAIVDGANVAKGKVMGKPSEEKQARADRVGRHLSYQLLDEMDEWEEETDQLLHILPCTGTVFRKTYFDPMKGRNCAELITAEKLVVNYWAKADAPRMTQVLQFYPHEILAKQRSGVWLDVDLGRPEGADSDEEAPHTFLEQHRLYDLDEDGYPEPYIVTVHKETQKVVRIYARYEARGILTNARGEVFAIAPVRYFTRYRFMPSLDGSYYGMGFGTLLDALNETINSTLNQLLDAGHLSNLQAGFIGAGVSLKSGRQGFKPGEWKKAEVSGGTLRENIVPLPVQQPSNVLFQLLGMLIEASKDITATKDILTGETGQANQPVGTTLAQIEQGLKVFSAIYKRIHRALKRELQALARLNAIYLDDETYYNFQDEEGFVAKEDYAADDVDVIPVSDPTIVTDMQRIGRAQFLMQFRADPLMDGAEINRRVLEAANISDVKSLFAPKPEGPPPEMQIAEKEVQQADRGLDLKEREVATKEAKTEADVALTMAQAQEKMMAAVLVAPQFQQMVAAFIDERAAQIAAGMNGPQPPEVRPGQFPGMEGPPADQAPLGLLPGQPGPPGGTMGGGGGDEPAAAMQGPPDGGAFGPGMG